jgi:hypothetical protein
MKNVQIQPNGCWLWNMFVNDNGYGETRVAGVLKKAHRFSYELHRGEIPPRMDLDHTCHNPSACEGGKSCIHRRCVNPDHLEPVTRKVNISRGCGGRSRNKKQCPHGHCYTLENTYLYKDRKHCRVCAATRIKDFRNARRDSVQLPIAA